MPVRIFNNITSLNAQRHLGVNQSRLSASVERISSGLRINKGSDDAAGLAISESLRSDIRALTQAVRNANDGISLINTAEGALNEQAGILIRMRELASQSSTGTVGSTQRQTIQLEFSALRDEIDRIALSTEFNGQLLIQGALDSQITAAANHIIIQIGIKNDSNSRINLNTSVDLTAITSTGLGITTLSVTASAQALTALASINSAINTVTSGRGQLGAVQNRLSRSIANLNTTIENLQSAESAIRDSDIAEEISGFTRNQVMVQASTSLLAQANVIPQAALQLLG